MGSFKANLFFFFDYMGGGGGRERERERVNDWMLSLRLRVVNTGKRQMRLTVVNAGRITLSINESCIRRMMPRIAFLVMRPPSPPPPPHFFLKWAHTAPVRYSFIFSTWSGLTQDWVCVCVYVYIYIHTVDSQEIPNRSLEKQFLTSTSSF